MSEQTGPARTGLRVTKGHGTENDFIILPDLDGGLSLTASLVQALCDRHAGIGADGVLRVVRSANDPAAEHLAGGAPFFMDYRNADGSLAEMCGNGVRVFFRYLRAHGLAGERTVIATRGGARAVWLAADGDVTVEMGSNQVLSLTPMVTAANSDEALPSVALEVPNPHVVVQVADEAALAALDLTRAPAVDPGLPNGQNVEFVVRTGPRRVAMRVHERGVGETRSCGTGICAAVIASARAEPADEQWWRVDVPGGSCRVQLRADGEVLLSGPAVLVGELDLDAGWLAAAQR